MKLNESIKLALCSLLHHLCDYQLRHRIESLVSFAHVLTDAMQKNQRERYDDVMHSLNMSAAMTAKMTKEFRSSPLDQAATILRFKKEEDEEDSPAPGSIKNLLWNFHSDLMLHCGEAQEESDEENSQGKFHFRWLKIKGFYVAIPITITLFSNHLKRNLSKPT